MFAFLFIKYFRKLWREKNTLLSCFFIYRLSLGYVLTWTVAGLFLGYYPVFTEGSCAFNGFVIVLSYVASLLTIMFISFNRWVSRPGVARPGVTRPGMARPGLTRPGLARPGWPDQGCPRPVVIESNFRCLKNSLRSPLKHYGSQAILQWNISFVIYFYKLIFYSNFIFLNFSIILKLFWRNVCITVTKISNIVFKYVKLWIETQRI